MISPKPSQCIHSSLDLIRRTIWSFNLKKKELLLSWAITKEWLSSNMLFSPRHMKLQYIFSNPLMISSWTEKPRTKESIPFLKKQMFNHHNGPKPTCEILRTDKIAKIKTKDTIYFFQRHCLHYPVLLNHSSLSLANPNTLLLCPFFTFYCYPAPHFMVLEPSNLSLNLNFNMQENKLKTFSKRCQWYFFFPGLLYFKFDSKESISWVPILFLMLGKKWQNGVDPASGSNKGDRIVTNDWPEQSSFQNSAEEKDILLCHLGVMDTLEEVLSWGICGTLLWRYAKAIGYLGLGP